MKLGFMNWSCQQADSLQKSEEFPTQSSLPVSKTFEICWLEVLTEVMIHLFVTEATEK